jgi:hypothetical protein
MIAVLIEPLHNKLVLLSGIFGNLPDRIRRPVSAWRLITPAVLTLLELAGGL